MRGGYNPLTDMIVEDVDTTLMDLGENVFGFTVGCKILKVKSRDTVESILQDAYSIIPTDEDTLSWLLACSAGNIVKKTEEADLIDFMSESAVEGLEQLMLRLAWSI